MLHAIDSALNQKHYAEIFVHIDMTASHCCCRFVSCTSMMWISRSITSQRCFIRLRSGDCGAHSSTVNALLCSVNQFVMIWALWNGVLSVPSEDRNTVVIEGWKWWATILSYAVVFKQCLVGTKVQSLHSTTSLNNWYKARWIHALMFSDPVPKWNLDIFPILYLSVLVVQFNVLCVTAILTLCGHPES